MVGYRHRDSAGVFVGMSAQRELYFVSSGNQPKLFGRLERMGESAVDAVHSELTVKFEFGRMCFGRKLAGCELGLIESRATDGDQTECE